MNKEEFLLKVSARYDKLESLNKIDNFYDYEKGFHNIWTELGREVFENNIGKVPANRRKKKPLPDTGR